MYPPQGFDRSIREPTFRLAASDASIKSKQKADIVCDGVLDENDWRDLVLALPVAGGAISFSEGHFYIDADSLRTFYGGVQRDVDSGGRGMNGATMLVNRTANPLIDTVYIEGISYLRMTDLMMHSSVAMHDHVNLARARSAYLSRLRLDNPGRACIAVASQTFESFLHHIMMNGGPFGYTTYGLGAGASGATLLEHVYAGGHTVAGFNIEAMDNPEILNCSSEGCGPGAIEIIMDSVRRGRLINFSVATPNPNNTLVLRVGAPAVGAGKCYGLKVAGGRLNTAGNYAVLVNSVDGIKFEGVDFETPAIAPIRLGGTRGDVDNVHDDGLCRYGSASLYSEAIPAQLPITLGAVQPTAFWRAGYYYFPLRTTSGSGPSNALTGANSLHSIYLPVDRRMAFDRIGISIEVAGGAGAIVRVGLYADNGTGYPGSRITGDWDIDATVIDERFVNFGAPLVSSPGLYHLVWNCNDATVKLRYFADAKPMSVRSDMKYGYLGFISAVAFGALPANFPGGGTPNEAYWCVALRKSANWPAHL